MGKQLNIIENMKHPTDNNVNNDESSDGSPYGDNTRQHFLSYLTSEINNLNSEIQRPGWTTWAVLGAIGTLIWLLLQNIQLGGYIPMNVAGTLLILFLLEFLFDTVRWVMTGDTKEKGRFLSHNLISKNRPVLIPILVRNVFIIFVALELSHDLGILVTATTSIIFSIFAVITIVIFILVTAKFPFPTVSTLRQRDIITSIVISIVLATIIWQYINHFLISNSILALSDFRLALLIWAVFFLIVFTLRIKRGNYILESLIAIRRKLALNQITLDTAISHTDIAISGLRSIDIFEEYISNLLTLYGEASAKLKESSHQLQNIEHILGSKQAPIPAAELVSITESVRTQIKEVLNITGDKIPKAFQPIEKRVLWIKSTTNISNIPEELHSKLVNAIEELKRQVDDVSQRLDSIEELIRKMQAINHD